MKHTDFHSHKFFCEASDSDYLELSWWDSDVKTPEDVSISIAACHRPHTWRDRLSMLKSVFSLGAYFSGEVLLDPEDNKKLQAALKDLEEQSVANAQKELHEQEKA